MLTGVLFVLELALMAVLLWVASSKRRFSHYPAVKTAASIGFLVLALAARFAGGPKTGFGLWALLFAGLCFCAAGDILLGFANLHGGPHGPLFRFGGLCFGAAHLIFCIRFLFGTSLTLLDAAAVVLGAGAVAVLEKTGKVRLKKQKALGVVYGGLVTFMCVKALDWWAVSKTATAMLCGVGSILFWLSDVALIFLYFGTHMGGRRQLRTMNLSLYYAGVVLLALSGGL